MEVLFINAEPECKHIQIKSHNDLRLKILK